MIPSSKWDVKGGIDMDHIVIGGIAMPRTKTLEVGGYYESKEAVMASGKTVRDVLGWRMEINAPWEWVPRRPLTQILPLVRGGYLLRIMDSQAIRAPATGTLSVGIRGQKIFQVFGSRPT